MVERFYFQAYLTKRKNVDRFEEVRKALGWTKYKLAKTALLEYIWKDQDLDLTIESIDETPRQTDTSIRKLKPFTFAE